VVVLIVTTKLHVERFIEVELAVKRLIERPNARAIPDLLEEWGFGKLSQEAAWVIAYDGDKNIRTIAEVARGSYHTSRVHIAPVLAAVTLAAADRFWLIHNHPSGDVRPTPADLELTYAVLQAANTCGLFLEDHVIVGPPKKHYSLKDHKLYVPPDISVWQAKELTNLPPIEGAGPRSHSRAGVARSGPTIEDHLASVPKSRAEPIRRLHAMLADSFLPVSQPTVISYRTGPTRAGQTVAQLSSTALIVDRAVVEKMPGPAWRRALKAAGLSSSVSGMTVYLPRSARELEALLTLVAHQVIPAAAAGRAPDPDGRKPSPPDESDRPGEAHRASWRP
jgi:hypothetical protein